MCGKAMISLLSEDATRSRGSQLDIPLRVTWVLTGHPPCGSRRGYQLDTPSGSRGSQLDTPCGSHGSQLNTPCGTRGSQLDTPCGTRGSQLNTLCGSHGSQLDTPCGSHGSQLDTLCENVWYNYREQIYHPETTLSREAGGPYNGLLLP